MSPHELGGWPQLLRITVPIETSPNQPLGSTTGMGDIEVLNQVLYTAHPWEFAFGPKLIVPSAARDRLGSGVWQLGFVAAGISVRASGLVGLLLTWERSLGASGIEGRKNRLELEPVLTYNLSGGWYLRSTAAWESDLEAGKHAIPVGVGMGRAWRRGARTLLNVFAEPQYCIVHDGSAPQWQVVFGVQMQTP